MKIIFGSDFHQNLEAYYRFTSLLENSMYEIGILGGDNCDYEYSVKEMLKIPGISQDDLIEELYDPDDSVEDLNNRIIEYRKMKDTPLYKSVRYTELKIRRILNRAKKKILVIRGNHDVSDWRTGKYIKNIEDKKYIVNGINFVGYRYTRLEIDEITEEMQIPKIRNLLQDNTILLTHAPPEGILDKNYRGISIGSKHIYELGNTDYVIFHLFGHVHDSAGITGKYVNGSYPSKKVFYSIDTTSKIIEAIEL